MRPQDLHLPSFLPGWTDWAVKLANWGPGWVPRPVRLLPLRLAFVVVQVCIWWQS